MSFTTQLDQLAGIDPNSSFAQALSTMANAQTQGSNVNTGAVAPGQLQGGGAITNAGSYQAPSFTMPGAAPAAQMPQQMAMAAPVNPNQPAGQMPPQPQGMPAGAPQGQPPQGGPVAPPQGAPVAPPQGQPVQTPVTGAAPVNPVNPAVAQAPVTQTPITGVNPATGQVNGQTTNEVTPQDLMGNNIFNSMLGVESGNQNYTQNGQPVTSARGAKYAAQVMPATAANPGYGIRPAQSDSPEEYNRVGREYFDAMRKKFGNDEQAVAAYNAGPGRVDHAIKLAEQKGGSWKDYLPSETKQYLAKVNPNAITAQADANQMGPSGLTGNKSHDQLIAAGNDPQKLTQIAFNDKGDYDDATKKAAASTLRDIMDHSLGMEAAKSKLAQSAQTGNMLPVLNTANQKTPEGSRFRAMLYELAGAKQAAADEYNKLGVGSSWVRGVDPTGKSYAIYSSPDGQARAAIDSETGQEVTDPKILRSLNGVGGTINTQAHMMPAVHGAPVTNGKETGLMMYDPVTRQQYVQVGNERRAPTGWTTLAQNPEAVQNAAAAKATGTFTGQGGTVGTGTAGGTVGAGAGNANNQVQPGYGSSAPLAQQKENLKVNTKERENFLKDREQIGTDAQAGQVIVDTKRAQTDQLYRNPEIMGLLTGTGAGYDELRNLLVYGARTPGDEADHRAAVGAALIKAGIRDPRTIEAINNYDAQQGRINGALVRQNLPGIQRITQNEFNYAKGSVLSNVATSTPMAVFQNNSREQFIGDITRAKNDYIDKNGIDTNNKLQQSWPKEQDLLYKQYAYVDDARNKWIANQMEGKTIPADSSDPNYHQYVNTVLHSFKIYPTPEYNPQSGRWDFGTAQADKAAKMARMKATIGQ
jgi:hypothetical protein